MKFYRCPWCGEEAFTFIHKITGTRQRGDKDRCPNCHKPYIQVSRAPFLSVLARILIGVIFVVCLLLLIGEKIGIVHNKDIQPLLAALTLLVFFAFILIFIERGMFCNLHKINEEGRYVPFVFSFRCRIRSIYDKTLRKSIKSRFKKDFIYGAIFECKDKYVYNQNIPIVFDKIIYKSKNEIETLGGFVLDEIVDESFLKDGMKFTLVDNDTFFATGEIIKILPVRNEKKTKKLNSRRKPWQDPDYFN